MKKNCQQTEEKSFDTVFCLTVTFYCMMFCFSHVACLLSASGYKNVPSYRVRLYERYSIDYDTIFFLHGK